MARALFDAKCILEPDLAHELATDPASPVPAAFMQERLRRFEARGCLQLEAKAWESETAEVAAKVERRLTRRFRDHLK